MALRGLDRGIKALNGFQVVNLSLDRPKFCGPPGFRKKSMKKTLLLLRDSKRGSSPGEFAPELFIMGSQDKRMLRSKKMGLRDQLSDPNTQTNLAADCARLMDEQVAAKGGLSGLALKAAYGVVKGVEPSYIPKAIQRLLPDALTALDSMWDEGVQSGNPVEHLIQNRSRTADMLLSITDSKIEKSSNGVVRASYNKLRKSVKGDVEEAVPGLAQILGRHTQVAG